MSSAKFYEGIYPPNNTSEKLVGKHFKAFNTPWSVIHSLRMEQEKIRDYEIIMGELDFVLLHPQYGLITIEVKGEGYKYEGNFWSYKGEKKRSPYQQLDRNTDLLFSKISGIGYSQKKVPNRSYVFWPYVGKDTKKGSGFGPEATSTNTLYKEDLGSLGEIKNLEERLVYGLEKSESFGSKGVSGRKFVSEVEDILLTYQDGVELKSKLGVVSDALDHATKEQIRVYQSITDPDNKFLKVTGPPGSGKTILAKEMAKEAAVQGKKVLFICYNVLLAEDIAVDCSKEKNIKVEKLLTFFKNIGVTVEDQGEGPSITNEKIRTQLDNKIDTALEKYDFDVLIMDESQDISPLYWDFFQLLVEEKNAKWVMFYDKRQSITHEGWKPPDLKTELGDSNIGLSRILRSTKEISQKNMNIYGDLSWTGESGEPPDFVELNKGSSKERLEEAKEIVSSLVYTFIEKDGFNRSQIVVLVPNGGYIKPFNIAPYKQEGKTIGSDARVLVTSIYKFKGMEKDIVILVPIDTESLGKGNYTLSPKGLLYSGIGRAKLHLVVVGNDKVKKLMNWSKG